MNELEPMRSQLERQVAHWRAATVTLDDADNFASRAAWASLENYLGLAIRRQLKAAVDRVALEISGLRAQLASARRHDELEAVRLRLIAFRRRFVQTETVLDFYGDAVNTRTSAKLAMLLRSCDLIAERSMDVALRPLGQQVPPVLTYIDKGLGASILRAGLRLWDGGSISPAAAIKITRHNLFRPTSLIHEAGHQFAHVVGWNSELATVLEQALTAVSARPVARMWSGWASEIAADCFAFVHTGYAAVAALHDVIAGEEDRIFTQTPGDPHPLAYLRVLLNTQMCGRFYGIGPWDALSEAWRAAHPLANAPEETRAIIQSSVELLPRIVDLCLLREMKAFGNRPLAKLVDPLRVSPNALHRLSQEAGAALFTSPYLIHAEPLRLLALSGLRMATEPQSATEIARQYESWMLRLAGASRQSA
jgi:hypothetical protein